MGDLPTVLGRWQGFRALPPASSSPSLFSCSCSPPPPSRLPPLPCHPLPLRPCCLSLASRHRIWTLGRRRREGFTSAPGWSEGSRPRPRRCSPHTIGRELGAGLGKGGCGCPRRRLVGWFDPRPPRALPGAGGHRAGLAPRGGGTQGLGGRGGDRALVLQGLPQPPRSLAHNVERCPPVALGLVASPPSGPAAGASSTKVQCREIGAYKDCG